jgi:tetratricopeptide (TPR) repeat protein
MQQDFDNHSQEMFGREPDLKVLIDRAQKPGLTAVTARPLMGKTWTLVETARRLSERGDCIVGYHESKGAESSHLLYVVSDLYARWLADSSMMGQAKSQWSRHKRNLIPKLGQALGKLFEISNEASGSNIEAGQLVRKTFEKLSDANKDLITGGVPLPPLTYDQARQLTNLVKQISGKKVILILDAWEKSLSLDFEHQTLEAFISHPEDWPEVHVFLGIRQPSLNDSQVEDKAFKKAKDLSSKKIAAEVYELPVMHIKNETYINELLIDYVKKRVPAAKQIDNKKLLKMIDGYPGVVSRWLDAGDQVKQEELSVLAKDAQQYRYREFEVLLENLSSDEQRISALIAFLPPLNDKLWEFFKEKLFAKNDLSVFYRLINKGVFENRDYPKYGHDTRHVAATNWFVENLIGLIKEEGRKIIWELITNVSTDIKKEKEAVVDLNIYALVACLGLVPALKMDKFTVFLSNCALIIGGFIKRPVLAEFKSAWHSAAQSHKQITPYLTYAYLYLITHQLKQDDKDVTDEDCTNIIELPGAPVKHIAIALHYRITLKSERGDSEGTIEDINTIIEMPDASPDTIAVAHGLRAQMKSEQGDKEGAIEDLTAIIDRPGVPADLISFALRNRGAIKKELGKNEEAMMDFTAITEMNDAPPDLLAIAHKYRASLKTENGDIEGAIKDYTIIIEAVDSPIDQKTDAWVYRGLLKSKKNDKAGAFEDIKNVIEMVEAPTGQRARAFNELYFLKIKFGEKNEFIEDCNSIIKNSDVPGDLMASALGCRGDLKSDQGDVAEAIEDYSAILKMPDIPSVLLETALWKRGLLREKEGDQDKAIEDYNAIIEMSSPTSEVMVRALGQRGFLKDKQGDKDGAIKDYTDIIENSDIPIILKAQAFRERGNVKVDVGDKKGALEDFSEVINISDAHPHILALAQCQRGLMKSDQGDKKGAVEDFSAVINMSNALPDDIAHAMFFRGSLKEEEGDKGGAIDDFEAICKMSGVSPSVLTQAKKHLKRINGK